MPWRLSLLRRVFRGWLSRFLGLGRGALEREVQVEARAAPLAHVVALALDQLGQLQRGRSLDIAHESRDARVRLRVAQQLDAQAPLPDRPKVHALGPLPHQLIEQVHGLRAVRLQRLDHLLAREQRLDLVLQLVDFGDLLVELGDLALQEFVAVGLDLDLGGVKAVHRDHDQDARQRGAAGEDEEMLPRALAALFAVREQVDAGDAAHCGSNLRIASPQATTSDGASIIRRLSWTFEEVCIAAKGFATLLGTCVRRLTTSSSPGITAEPPASRM